MVTVMVAASGGAARMSRAGRRDSRAMGGILMVPRQEVWKPDLGEVPLKMQ